MRRRQARAGAGRREEPRDRDARRRPGLRRQPPDAPPASARAGQRCMAISVAVAVGDAADELVEKLRAKAIAVKVGPGPGARLGDGPGRHRRRPRPHLRLHRPRRGRRRRRRPRARDRGRRLLGRPDADRQRPAPTRASTPTRSSARCSCVVRVESLDEAIELDQPQPVRQRHRDLHRLRPGRARVPAQDPGRHDRHQRADPGPDELLLLRRLEAVAVRRPPHPRPRGHHASTRAARSSRRAGPSPWTRPTCTSRRRRSYTWSTNRSTCSSAPST